MANVDPRALVLSSLSRKAPSSRAELAAMTGLPPEQVGRWLVALEREQLVKRTGTTRTTVWVRV